LRPTSAKGDRLNKVDRWDQIFAFRAQIDGAQNSSKRGFKAAGNLNSCQPLLPSPTPIDFLVPYSFAAAASAAAAAGKLLLLHRGCKMVSAAAAAANQGISPY
jgi:hypothetical protein